MTGLPDPAVFRADAASMRRALDQVVESVGDAWSGPLPEVLDALIAVGRTDLTLGRLVEGHVDAVRILDQAGRAPAPGRYGVWASRSAGTGVRAERDEAGWRLTGELRFASGADLLDRALVAAYDDAGVSHLFDIAAGDVKVDPGSWPTHAMDASRSFTVHVDLLAPHESLVGPPGFYLHRPGFVLGGLCVAAVWVGGAAQVLDRVVAASRRFPASAHQARRVGLMRQVVWQAEVAVQRAGAAGPETQPAEVAHARHAAVLAADVVVEESAKVVGPGGLTTDTALVRVRDDLGLYARQHHLDAALEDLGRATLDQLPRETS